MKLKTMRTNLVMLITILIIACGGLSQTLPDTSRREIAGQEEATLSPPATVAGEMAKETSTPSAPNPTTTNEVIAIQTETEIIIPTPTLTPVPVANTTAVEQQQNVSPTIETPVITNSPTFTPPPPTSLPQPEITPNPPMSEATSEFQITEAQIETDASGKTQLSLPITLNKSALQSPVQELVYLITNPLDDQLAETTIWRVNLKDISNPTAIASIQHLRRSAGAANPTLSPDGKYLVYGQEFDDRTGAQLVWLLDINDGTRQIITKDAQPQNNSQTFLWSADSESILYTTASSDWSFSALNQYFIETEKTEVVFSDNGFINLVGWWNQFIYYIPLQISGPPYNFRSFNFETKQLQEILTINESYAINNIKMSPDGTQTLFTVLLVNLQSKSQTRLPSSSQVLWFPDGQGLLGGSPLSALYINEINQQSADNVTSTLKLSVDIDGEQLVSWSPGGQYLIYKARSENNQIAHFLLDLHSGRTQQFPPTRIFQIGGWLTTQ